ncbi:hypothetical protein RhiLY_12448 [Ceratobasidium sp. AG-Ba]|nr:hypothetical protein RhiLY_12448 [Ceratobasidium sp. AG-Ba]
MKRSGTISSFAKQAIHGVAIITENSAPTIEATNHRIDILLRPLRRINFMDFTSAFGEESSVKRSNHNKLSDSLGSKFRATVGFSSRALERLRGMEVQINTLCNVWKDQDTGSFMLRRIECFREKSGAHHEYLIAKITTDIDSLEDANGLWLRLERRPKTLDGMREYVSGFMGKFEAHDLVTIARRREDLLHREDESLEFRASMTFPGSVSLSYMLEILRVIHEESPTYHIVGAHCWFFASVIIESLMSHGVWDHGQVAWYDHWKSKNYINREQYRAITNRIKQLNPYQLN